jgi:hypothetical protein
MNRQAILALTLAAFLQGCTGMSVASISERDAKGKDVDQIVSELKAKGLSCGVEHQIKAVDTGHSFGEVMCGTKEVALVCPESYQIPIVFELSTRKVLSLNKSSRTNCF